MANNVMFFCIAFVMLCKMRMRRVVRRLSQKGDGAGWQVVWIESPVEPATQTMPHVYPNEENEMKKISSRRGCLIGSGLALLLILLLGGGLWIVGSRSLTFDGAALSSVVVTITSPVSGDEASVGDFVSVTAEAVATETVQELELFLDGQSLGKVPGSNASWTWQAWPLGVHSFYAQATDIKGNVGYSQVILVQVLAGDGVIEGVAGDGQTLPQIGAGYGVQPDVMIETNPKIDPSLPLTGGKQVKIPIGNGGSGNGSGQGQTPGGGAKINPIPNSVLWIFKPTQPVDKSYCYTSGGAGIWEKIPKNPFDFFQGVENLYTQLNQAANQTVIQAQCWGWIGDVLKYLGQGQAQFDANNPPNEIVINAEGFFLTGIPNIPHPPLGKGGGPASVPPPFALREPKDANECISYGDPVVAGFLCNALMNAKVKQNIVLIWEWKPEVCWPGFCKYGADTIAGYTLYEYDPFTHQEKYLADIKPSAKRVAFVPLPWGAKCYVVEAYADSPGSQVSEKSAVYCPGNAPTAKKVTLTNVTEWLTTEDVLSLGEDCPYTQAHVFRLDNSGFGSQPGEVYIGAAIRDSEGGIGVSDCYMDEYYQGGVKFNLESEIPSNAVVQKAILRFSDLYQTYSGGAGAAPKPSSCVLTVNGSNQSWSGMIDADHWINGTMPYGEPSVSVNPYTAPQADVTSIVSKWMNKPGSNFGFVLRGWFPALPTEEADTSLCVSAIGNFELDVYYFPAP